MYACDGNQYFSRPGPRLVDGIEILAEVIHLGAAGKDEGGKGPASDARWRRLELL